MAEKGSNGWLSSALVMALAGAAVPAAGQTPESVTIPLQVVNVPSVGTKVGIRVGLGGGPPKLYTFDTGSSGMYAAYNPAWWPSFTPLGGLPISQSYGSNLALTADAVSTVITIPTDHGELSITADVGQIVSAGGNADGEAWMANVAAGIPPLYGMFYGDFGSGLTKPPKGLFAVLPQLPGNLSSGFAVQLGCSGGGPESKVVVGLTPAIRARVTSWVKMEAEPDAPPYPQSHRPSYTQALVAGSYSLARPGASYDFSAPTILDTGGGTADIHQASPLVVPDALLDAGKNRVLSGTQFSLKAPGTAGSNDLDMSFVTGSTSTIDLVTVSQAKPPSSGGQPKPEVNVGLVPFFRYDIVFDVERGNVGFAPCTAAAPVANAPIPTLSTWAIGLLAAALALVGAFATTLRTPRRSRHDRG
ncbi:MAG: IPTL-CTERM sorting domain-containing protein [Burkholderiales bacterium]